MIVFSFAVPVIPISYLAIECPGRLFVALIRFYIVETVGEIIWIFSTVAVYSHLAVTLVIIDSKRTFVDRYLLIIYNLKSEGGRQMCDN